jgi:hypothetical protein
MKEYRWIEWGEQSPQQQCRDVRAALLAGFEVHLSFIYARQMRKYIGLHEARELIHHIPWNRQKDVIVCYADDYTERVIRQAKAIVINDRVELLKAA